MRKKRMDNELPLAVKEWGWRYHHIGIPTKDSIAGEKYMPKFKLFTGGFDSSPYGIEWMRYEPDSPIPELIKRIPHIAFEVDNLDLELKKRKFKIITPPNSPGSGTRVAMIEHNGVPIELIEFKKKIL
ncbi:MAG TPA: VOC family protein [Bacteroidales bacterium]|nr:VOC family protein [Bacteroidales bacterium]